MGSYMHNWYGDRNRRGNRNPKAAVRTKDRETVTNVTKLESFFYGPNGEDLGKGHANVRGEIEKGPLEIKTVVEKGKTRVEVIGEYGEGYNVENYIKLQASACARRKIEDPKNYWRNSFVYTYPSNKAPIAMKGFKFGEREVNRDKIRKVISYDEYLERRSNLIT